VRYRVLADHSWDLRDGYLGVFEGERRTIRMSEDEERDRSQDEDEYPPDKKTAPASSGGRRPLGRGSRLSFGRDPRWNPVIEHARRTLMAPTLEVYPRADRAVPDSRCESGGQDGRLVRDLDRRRFLKFAAAVVAVPSVAEILAACSRGDRV